MNKVILMGRLTRDPEVRYSQGAEQMAIARYTLAVDRRVRSDSNEQSADFIRCIAFRQKAEFAEKYLQKGTKIVIVGHIQTGSYTNRDGQKVYTTDVVIDEQEFAESRSHSQDRGEDQQQEPACPYPPVDGDGFMNVPDDMDGELPFN